jgi:hypothetical protein
MTVDRDQLQDLIQADLDGELAAAGRAELARLLLQDPEARRLHDEFRRTDQLLRGVLQAAPPVSLREAILATPALTTRSGAPARRQYAWPPYRVAAAILGGLLVVGIGYFLRDDSVPLTSLQGSLDAPGGPGTTGLVEPQDQLSIRAEGVEVNASLRRDGQGLRLEVNLSAGMPCEVVAKFDPATTTYIGKPDDARFTAANGQVTVQSAAGSRDFVLDFSGAAPIELQLRSGRRLLGEGKLSVSAP